MSQVTAVSTGIGSAVAPVRGRRRRRRNVLIGVGVVVVVLAAVGAAAKGIGGADAATHERSKLPPATTPVKRTTLVQTELVSGTLGYGTSMTLSVAAASGSGQGGDTNTFTWLPAPGSTVARGQPAYKVNDKPVPVLYGTLPLFRTLRSGVEGADAKELEKNLAALGYTGFTVDDEFTSATASAVKKWQSDLGLTETGTVEPRQVAIAPGKMRITSVTARLGGAVSGDVLVYASTTRVVTVQLKVALQHLIKAGDAVTVTLPDGKTVTGTVQSVGTVATEADNATTVDVVIGLADQRKLGGLDKAPVKVAVVSGQAKGVLAVPIEALIVLAEGGYGVQVVEGGTVHDVAVKTGMFAGGRVEITGTGIAEGTLVGVPS